MVETAPTKPHEWYRLARRIERGQFPVNGPNQALIDQACETTLNGRASIAERLAAAAVVVAARWQNIRG